jgi:hypothetical protein
MPQKTISWAKYSAPLKKNIYAPERQIKPESDIDCRNVILVMGSATIEQRSGV